MEKWKCRPQIWTYFDDDFNPTVYLLIIVNEVSTFVKLEGSSTTRDKRKITGGVKYFDRLKPTAVCVIVYNKFFTLINLNVHSFEAIIYRK